jgi:HSP20 family molecular chaperone IbpA
MSARDRRFWVLSEALDLLKGAERMQRRFTALDALQSPPCWEPPVDMYEQDDELRLLVALPGVNARLIEVLLDSSGIVVRGKRPMPPTLSGVAIHRLEIPYGRFERRLALPSGNFRLHEQFLEDGCLVLVLRRL